MLVSTAIALGSTTKTKSTKAPRGVAAAIQTVKRDQQVLRFFHNHKWLLSDPRFAAEARRQIVVHRKSLRAAERFLSEHRRKLKLKRKKQLARRLASARAAETPAQTICRIFGAADCQNAVSVARCESGLRTDARNGQYLGLFQMGEQERRLFGHGDTAEEQARAALRYFVFSGRDWSPWSCRPH